MQEVHDVVIAAAFFSQHGAPIGSTNETAVVDKVARYPKRAVARGGDRQSGRVLLTGRIASRKTFFAVGSATSAASRLHEAAAMSVRVPAFRGSKGGTQTRWRPLSTPHRRRPSPPSARPPRG